MSGGLYVLSVDAISGTWWQTMMTVPFEECLAYIEVVEGRPVELEPVGTGTLRADGAHVRYFVSLADPDAVECRESGPMRAPYVG